MDFNEEFKWCPACQRDVNYLQSLQGFYCAECGGKVKLFRDRKAAMAFRNEVVLTDYLRMDRPPEWRGQRPAGRRLRTPRARRVSKPA